MRFHLVLGFLLVLFVAYGTGLMCYHCTLSRGKCISGAKNCSNGETCFERVGQAVGFKLYMAGCIAKSSCGKVVSQNFGDLSFSLNTTCCNVDLCNAGSAVRMPLLSVLALALGSLASMV